jgi:hypothetical protein
MNGSLLFLKVERSILHSDGMFDLTVGPRLKPGISEDTTHKARQRTYIKELLQYVGMNKGTH